MCNRLPDFALLIGFAGKDTGGLDGAFGTSIGASAVYTSLTDAEMTQSEIVAEGVVSIVLSEMFGDQSRCFAVDAFAIDHAEVPAQPAGMGVERHQKGRRSDAIPQPHVDGARTANNPAKE